MTDIYLDKAKQVIAKYKVRRNVFNGRISN